MNSETFVAMSESNTASIRVNGITYMFAATALLLGPTLVAAIARGRFGLWLIGLLFGRRGIHSEADNSTLIRRAGIWVDKETLRHTGTAGQVHVPRCFSKKHRELYLIMLAHISQSLRSLDANS